MGRRRRPTSVDNQRAPSFVNVSAANRTVGPVVRDHDGVSGFQAAELRWIEQLVNLRNVVRQEVIARQLAEHGKAGMSVLDVGCGQGTQALRLASRGCRVTGVDPSPDLLGRFAAGAAAASVSVELVEGRIEELDERFAGREFDLVCAHGLLMYLADRAGALRSLAARVIPGGLLSITFRNGHALALRPGLRHEWAGALASFDSRQYVNELGVLAEADRIEDVERDLADVDMQVLEWFGVRVFNDAAPSDTKVPDDEELALLLEAEHEAGRRDPYRWIASQIHIIASRVAADQCL